jgi:FkbM family methyltransferase
MQEQANDLAFLTRLPRPFFLNGIYRGLMRMSRNHGLHTLARLNNRLFPEGEIVRLPTGNEFYVPGDPHLIGYVLSRHDHHITRVMQEKISPGDLCVDIGANLGYFTCVMAALCAPGGRILSFEPESANYRTLCINAEIASAAGVQIVPTEVAISNVTSKMELIRGAEVGMHQVGRLSGNGKAELIEGVRLADVPAAVETPISFLKIDVEGHEFEVLEGCAALLDERRVTTAVVEIFPGEGAEKVDRLLRRWSPTVSCWLNDSWTRTEIRSLPYRTDVLLEFDT